MKRAVTAVTVLHGHIPRIWQWIAMISPHVSEILLIDSGCSEETLKQVAGFECVRLVEPTVPLSGGCLELFIKQRATQPHILLLHVQDILLDNFWKNLPGYLKLIDSYEYKVVELNRLSCTLKMREDIESAADSPEVEKHFRLSGRYEKTLVHWTALGQETDVAEIVRGTDPLIRTPAANESPRIMVGLLVHENAEVVIDQIENIQFFNPNIKIVLHLSEQFRAQGHWENCSLAEREEVYVNPESLATDWATTSLIRAMVSNFRFVTREADFDYFLLHASNDLYVHRGAEGYLSSFAAGCALDPLAINRSPQSAAARRDRGLMALCDYLGGATARVAGHEGSFFRTELFEEMATLIERYAVMDEKPFTFFGDPNGDYGKEEYYLPTLAGALTASIGQSLVYRDFAAQPSIDISHIKMVIDRDYGSLPIKQNGDFYAVKRIDRTMDDASRIFVRTHKQQLEQSMLKAEAQ